MRSVPTKQWTMDQHLFRTFETALQCDRSIWCDRTSGWDEVSVWAQSGLIPYAVNRVLCHVSPVSSFRSCSGVNENSNVMRKGLLKLAAAFCYCLKDGVDKELGWIAYVIPNLRVRMENFRRRVALPALRDSGCFGPTGVGMNEHNWKLLIDSVAGRIGDLVALSRAWPTAERLVGRDNAGLYLTSESDALLSDASLVVVYGNYIDTSEAVARTSVDVHQYTVDLRSRHFQHLTFCVESFAGAQLLEMHNCDSRNKTASIGLLAEALCTDRVSNQPLTHARTGDPVLLMLRSQEFWFSDCYCEHDKTEALLGYIGASAGEKKQAALLAAVAAVCVEASEDVSERVRALNLTDETLGRIFELQGLVRYSYADTEVVVVSSGGRTGGNSLPGILGTCISADSLLRLATREDKSCPNLTNCLLEGLRERLDRWEIVTILDPKRRLTPLSSLAKVVLGLSLASDGWHRTRSKVFNPELLRDSDVLCVAARPAVSRGGLESACLARLYKGVVDHVYQVFTGRDIGVRDRMYLHLASRFAEDFPLCDPAMEVSGFISLGAAILLNLSDEDKSRGSWAEVRTYVEWDPSFLPHT